MKNDIAFRLAKASVLKEKRNYIISFSMMIIAFMFTFIFSGYLTLTKESNTIQRKLNYGGWSVCYEDQNQITKDFFKNSEAIDDIAVLEVSHILSNGNYIANYSSDYFTMNSITLLEGELPSKDNEVLVLKGTNKNIGDSIEISAVYPHKSTKTYKVVGIINDYNKLWMSPSADYFVYDHDVHKEYTYLATSLMISDLIDIDDCIYNYSLLDRNISVEVDKNRGYHYDFTLGKSDDNTIMNTFIIVISVGLFIAVFYNVNQREKSVFLLRCIGMSKRNMRKYIFYEVIIVGIVALTISLAVGIVALLGFSIVVYKQIGTFLFVNAFIKSLSYICVLLFITVCFVYLSILPISVHSMDSLIHKKERKIMKKYYKAKKMSIFNLSEKMSGRYSQYISALTALIVVQAICLNAINSYSQYFDYNEMKDSYGQYSYLLNCKDEAFYENMSDVIVDYKPVTYVEKYLDTNWKYAFYKLEGMEHLLKDGRLPQNNKECLVFETDRYIFSRSYKIGDVINVIANGGAYSYDDNGNNIDSDAKIMPMTIVGSIDLEDYYGFWQNMNYIFPADERMFAVYEDTFNKEDWADYTYLATNKDIFFQLNELSTHHNHQDQSTNRVEYNNLYFFGNIHNNNSTTFVTNQMLIYVPVIAISVLFVVFIIRLLVDKLNKDYKLVRCLGMTFKQTMWSYVYIGITFTILPMIYYIFTFINRYNYYQQFDIIVDNMSSLLFPVILIIVLCALHFAGFMIYAYKKTSSTVTFYPTDVERYY